MNESLVNPKERPFIAYEHEVKAILDEQQSQIRRLMYPQPRFAQSHQWNSKLIHESESRTWCWRDYAHNDTWAEINRALAHLCPYGNVGDHLWAKETWYEDWEHSRYFYKADAYDDGHTVPYLVDGEGSGGGVGSFRVHKWNSQINMPRHAARILLRIKRRWIEPLQAISEQDAIASGIGNEWCDAGPSVTGELSPVIETFASLWNGINKPSGFDWAANPWVWCVEFEHADSN